MHNPTLKFQSDTYEVWYEQGMILANSGSYQEALTHIDRIMSIEPGNPKVWVFRGGVLTYLNRYKEALTCFEQALRIQPDDKTACLFQGMALHHLGHYKKAYACYDRWQGVHRHSVWQKLIEMLNIF